jgi:hypothetical protein
MFAGRPVGVGCAGVVGGGDCADDDGAWLCAATRTVENAAPATRRLMTVATECFMPLLLYPVLCPAGTMHCRCRDRIQSGELITCLICLRGSASRAIVVAGLMRAVLEEGDVRRLIASATVAVVLLLPRSGSAQILQPTGPPVVYQGGLYFPSGPTVFFDGATMVRVGTFRGLPVYVDPSLDPINVVLVPIGGKLMRPFERTNGDIQADLVVPDPPDFPDPPEPTFGHRAYFDRRDLPPYALTPTLAQTATVASASSPAARGPASRGLWIAFDGRMWTPTGPGPVQNSQGPRLKMIGSHFGFPVFQEAAHPDRIFVPATAGGPLIQYDRRPE